VLESDVARELSPLAAQILRDFVGERAWHLGPLWQALHRMLEPSEQASLTMALGQHAIRWIVTQFSARVMARTMEALPSDSVKLVEALMETRQHAPQMFPDFVGRQALSEEDCHRLIFACDAIPA
jgi:hypothetical protein